MSLPCKDRPIAMIDAYATYLPAEEEDESGFEVRCLHLGAVREPSAWASLSGSSNPVADEHESMVVNAFVRLAPAGPVKFMESDRALPQWWSK